MASPQRKLLFAVCTKSCILVDQHFGHASEFSIFTYEDGRIYKTDTRSVQQYCMGAGECDPDERIRGILKAVSDCKGIICLRIGPEPAEALKQNGISVFMTCEEIETAIESAAQHF